MLFSTAELLSDYERYLCHSFRYGREDEEVMGLKFCNEAIIALQLIWPRSELGQNFQLSPLQVLVLLHFFFSVVLK